MKLCATVLNSSQQQDTKNPGPAFHEKRRPRLPTAEKVAARYRGMNTPVRTRVTRTNCSAKILESRDDIPNSDRQSIIGVASRVGRAVRGPHRQRHVFVTLYIGPNRAVNRDCVAIVEVESHVCASRKIRPLSGGN